MHVPLKNLNVFPASFHSQQSESLSFHKWLLYNWVKSRVQKLAITALEHQILDLILSRACQTGIDFQQNIVLCFPLEHLLNYFLRW